MSSRSLISLSSTLGRGQGVISLAASRRGKSQRPLPVACGHSTIQRGIDGAEHQQGNRTVGSRLVLSIGRIHLEQKRTEALALGRCCWPGMKAAPNWNHL